jgi:hypothetical protein
MNLLDRQPIAPRCDALTVGAVRATDPLWVALLEQAGFRLARRSASYVWYDGRGEVAIAPDEELDADDTLAQIILHEMIHLLVQGEEARTEPDWGLDNLTDRDAYLEEAALVMQLRLLRQWGLEAVLVPTTDFRGYYLTEASAEARANRLQAAAAGWARWLAWPQREAAERALRATYEAVG